MPTVSAAMFSSSYFFTSSCCIGIKKGKVFCSSESFSCLILSLFWSRRRFIDRASLMALSNISCLYMTSKWLILRSHFCSRSLNDFCTISTFLNFSDSMASFSFFWACVHIEIDTSFGSGDRQRLAQGQPWPCEFQHWLHQYPSQLASPPLIFFVPLSIIGLND